MVKWKFDSAHSSVEFSVQQLGVIWFKGSFTSVNGSAMFDPSDPEKSFWNAQIEAKSISTGDYSRDNLMKSKDFFDAENHPIINFNSTQVKKVQDNSFKITGDLTILGITKPAALDVEFSTLQEIISADGKTMNSGVGFSAKTKINRHDFGIWKAGGGIASSKLGGEVDITINIVAIEEQGFEIK